MFGRGATVVKKAFSTGCMHKKSARWVTTTWSRTLILKKLKLLHKKTLKSNKLLQATITVWQFQRMNLCILGVVANMEFWETVATSKA